MELPDGFYDDLIDWGGQSSRTFPWREEPSPFEIIVAEVLLQATFAEKVEPVYETLIDEYPTPEALASANQGKLEDMLRPLGLQNRKAESLISIGKRISGGTIPSSLKDIEDLPGIGSYGANAVLCFGFDERMPIVDTNVVRIYNRVLSLDLKSSEDTRAWGIAEELLPLKDFEEYNLALLDLGAEICTSKNPSCKSCPVNDYCEYFEKLGEA